MPSIDIEREHKLPVEEAKRRVAEAADDLKAKMGFSWSWQADTLHFRAEGGAARGTKGTFTVTPNRVSVHIDLPFLLSPMKGMVAKKIEEKLAALSA